MYAQTFEKIEVSSSEETPSDSSEDEEDLLEHEVMLQLKNLEKETPDNYRIETFSSPFSYISKGLYARQLQIWFDLFPKENILITSTEEMAFNPQHFMNKIFDFLNISKYDIKNPQKRKSENYPKIKSETIELASAVDQL